MRMSMKYGFPSRSIQTEAFQCPCDSRSYEVVRIRIIVHLQAFQNVFEY